MVNASRLLTRLLTGGMGYRQAPVFLGDRVFALTRRRHIIYLVPSDADLTPRILRDGAWEIDVEETIAKLLRRGDTVVEVGANVGYHTLAIADRVGPKGQVHAFEANPELMGLLNATMYANGFSNWRGIGRVNLYEGAVLDRAGVVTLAFAPGHYASGHVIDGIQPSPAYSKRVETPAVTLDQMLAERVEKVDLIRMDIEGSEPLALRGAEALISRSPTVKIVMEWFVDMMRARADVEAFVAWLVEFGFKFWTIKPGARLVKMDPSMAPTAPPCEMLLSRQAV